LCDLVEPRETLLQQAAVRAGRLGQQTRCCSFISWASANTEAPGATAKEAEHLPHQPAERNQDPMVHNTTRELAN
jgi:hypothetical protein